MKKILVLTMLLMFGFCSYAQARVQYDETGRNIVQDNTIRGQKRAAQYKAQQRAYAAAGKLNYEENSSAVSDWAKKHTYKTFKPTPNYRYYER